MPDARTSSPWRIELASTLRLGWPLALANLLQMLVYAVDVIFVARLGEIPLAAASLGIALFGTLMWAFSGLTGMVAALISAALGRGVGMVRAVRRATRMALWLAVVCGVLTMIPCLFAEEIMLATGQDPEVARRSGEFLWILMWASVPMIVANVLRNYIAALGKPVFATVIIGLAVGVAALGNYMLVFGNLGAPALGLEGSALAGVITSVFTVIAYAVAILTDRGLARYRVFGRLWSPDWKVFGQLVRLGTPVFLMVVAEAGLFNGAAFMMGRIGATELAGHTIALQVAALAFQVPFGLSQAATIRVGYHYGAGDRAGIARAGWSAIALGGGFMLLTAAIMLFAPQAVLSIYVDVEAPRNAAMVAFAMKFLTVAAAFQLFDGIQAVAGGVLRGLQDTRVPMMIAIFSYWVPGLAAMVWLGFWTPLAGMGIWLGLLVGLVSAAGLLLGRWLRRERLGLA